MTITKQHFGVTATGEEVSLFTLSNASTVLTIINLGAIIQSIHVPDSDGNVDDIALGYERLAPYENCPAFFGCVAGRFANRIANGRFNLDGTTYTLAQNDGPNHLHGGPTGFNTHLWQAQIDEAAADPTLVLTHVSPDGDSGYPGTLTTVVRYSLSAQNELTIDYRATTDKPTILNLTNHSYFNLLGQQHATKNSVLNHELMLNASRYVPTNATAIPLGHLADVGNTPMDFRTSTAIGAQIEQEDEQLHFGTGYDHTWVLDKPANTPADALANTLSLAARVVEPTCGRVLEVYTTQPGVQFYSSNHMSSLRGKKGVEHDFRCAFCLETQHFPDAPNQPDFPSTVLRPTEEFHQVTKFKFATV